MFEYSISVWSPHTQSDINMIEKVQHHFTHRVLDDSPLSFHERFKILHLETLELHRQKNDLTLVYKIFQNEVDIERSLIFYIIYLKYSLPP